jgi:hypothetical protein
MVGIGDGLEFSCALSVGGANVAKASSKHEIANARSDDDAREKADEPRFDLRHIIPPWE